MNKALYLECYSGISGDMTVAALLDLGAEQKVLETALSSLPIQGFKTKISRVLKSGLDACDFEVILDKAYETHDHDMDYLHNHEHGHEEQHNKVENEHQQQHLHEHSLEHLHEHKLEYKHEHHHEHEHNHVNNNEYNLEQHHEHHHEHKHNHEFNHEHTHEHFNENEHEHNHEHKQEHSHEHQNNHIHEHRNLTEILEIIDHSEITVHAKEIASHIFKILANAEAKAHGVDLEQVHFHEVGAVDSIVDIIAVAVCLDNLGISKVIVSELYEGKGFIRCQHGMIPVPVPAVSHIAADHGLHLHIMNSEGEFVTPTGAAIVAAIKTSDKLPENFSFQKIGIGAGKRSYERPSILRAMLIQDETVEKDSIYQLESNIDDCSGEALGYAMERLFEAGARDVYYMPVYMKKNRPAYLLNVICDEEDIKKLEQIIFEETTTIGIRRIRMERTVLRREIKKVITSLGEVQIKTCDLATGKRVYPEYSSIVELCKKHQMSYQDVYKAIMKEI